MKKGIALQEEKNLRNFCLTFSISANDKMFSEVFCQLDFLAKKNGKAPNTGGLKGRVDFHISSSLFWCRRRQPQRNPSGLQLRSDIHNK